MKKLLVALLCAVTAVGCLAACGSSKKSDTEAKGEGVMTYAEFDAAALDSEVTIETYVQDHQSWWDNTVTLYTQDKDGGYFIYNCACSEEDAAKLVPGTKIKVKGYKSEWSGEVEVVDASFEFEDGNYVAPATDVTSVLGTDDLKKYMNQYVSIKDVTIESANDAGESFLYNWDGSGEEGSDLYFTFSCNGQNYTFTVESYLRDQTTDTYQTVKTLKVGDKVDLEGFLYWYEGPQAHITNVTIK